MNIGVLGLSPSSTSLIRTIQKAASGGGAAPSNPDFISTWDTTKAGSSSDTVVLPLTSGGIYSGEIDWGDGNSDPLSYANRTHIYASSGVYTITISGDTFEGWRFVLTGDRLKLTEISNWGFFTLKGDRIFDGCSNLDITATDAPIVGTSTFYCLFRFCAALTSPDFSNWDVSTVTNMSEVFSSCTNFNGDLTGWIHSGVTSVSRMLSSATSFNQDLSSWDVSSVTGWYEFMRGATSFNSSLAGWSVNGSFNELAFGSMTAFTGIGLDSWDTSGVVSFRKAFANAPVFNPDVSGWDLSNTSNIQEAFQNCDSFDQNLSNWNIANLLVGTNFMQSATGLSTANYDATLVGWENTLQTIYPGGSGYPATINIHFGGSKYSSELMNVGEARYNLINVFGWTITDGGAV
jgi:surface protein